MDKEDFVMIEKLFVMIKDNPTAILATLSIILNIYLFNKVLFFNDKYIGLLIKNAGVQEQLNKLLNSFHVKRELILVEKQTGEINDGNTPKAD